MDLASERLLGVRRRQLVRFVQRRIERLLRLPSVPDSYIAGRIPTLNGHGFMEVRLNEMSRRFVEECDPRDGPVLDMGCAYGVATLTALDRRLNVVACDRDARHLRVLRWRTPLRHQTRLRTKVGALPEVDFPRASFSAIHSARCLHFLRPHDLRRALWKMREWLRPGGRAYFMTTTGHASPWNNALTEIERRAAAGDLWPGLIEDVLTCLPLAELEAGMPSFINTLDPSILERECLLAGFRVLEVGFMAVPEFSSGPEDHAVLIAQRPNDTA